MSVLKVIGCLLILYSSFMTGHAVGNFYTRMVKEMEELLLIIQIIKSQIIYEGTELPELLEKCEQRSGGAVRIWIRSLRQSVSECRDKPFAKLWQESMTVLADLTAVRGDVLDEVRRLGDILGDMDVEAQISRITLVESVITDKYERERYRNGGVRRLAHSLGFLGGVFIVIMLL